MSLLVRSLAGLAWAYGSMAGERVLSLVTTAVLARILYPNDFGVIALAFIVLGYIDTLRDFGIKDALIYTPDRRDEMIGTAATLGLVVGITQSAVGIAAAPLATFVVEDGRVVLMIQLLSLSFIVNALSLTPDGLLQKHLSFRARCVADVFGAAVKATVTVSLALSGAGVWAIAAGHLAGATARTIGRFAMAATRVRFRYERECAATLWRFGKHILFVNIVGAVLARADQIAVALFIGSSALGYYFIASRIPELVVGSLSVVLTLVLFPAFAKLNQDAARLKSAFLSATRFTALIAVPASVGLVALAPELVLVVFGRRWLPSAPMLQVLAAVSLIAALGWNAGDLFKAVGRPELQTRLICIEAAVAIPLVLLFAWSTMNPARVAMGYLIGVSASTVGRIWIVSTMLRLRLSDLARLYGAPLLGGVAIIAFTTLSRSLVQDGDPRIALAFLVVAGAGVYLGIICWLDSDSVRTALNASRAVLRPRHALETGPANPVGRE
jgi:PST family polysaccharide transporter